MPTRRATTTPAGEIGAPPDCPHCAALVLKNKALQDEIRALKAQLGLKPDDPQTLREALGLPPRQARILARLYRAAPGYVASEMLLPELATPTDGNLKVAMHKLKKRIGPDCISFTAGSGYRLMPSGAARLDEILAGAK